MSDGVQSEYKKYVDSRMEPSEEFLTRLKQTLREEADREGIAQAERNTGKVQASAEEQKGAGARPEQIAEFPGRSRFPYFAAAAAAVLALAVGITAFSYFGLSQKPQAGEEPPAEGTLSHYAGETDAGVGQGNIIGNPGWWDESLTAESLPKALAQKMEVSLERLSGSRDNKFVDAGQESAEETARIIKMLRDGTWVSGSAEEPSSDNTLYYMAVFTDGTVAKFRIADERYLVIAGEEIVYERKEMSIK